MTPDFDQGYQAGLAGTPPPDTAKKSVYWCIGYDLGLMRRLLTEAEKKIVRMT